MFKTVPKHRPERGWIVIRRQAKDSSVHALRSYKASQQWHPLQYSLNIRYVRVII